MDPLYEYAHHWLRGTAVYLQRPFDLELNKRWITDIEGGRPGFARQLRLVALNALEDGDWLLVHKAIAALAAVGEAADVPRLQAVAALHEKEVRTAIFEIEHGAPAS